MSRNNKIAFLCHPYHRGGVTRWMADAAAAFAEAGKEVYFVTVEPKKAFFSAKGRETLLQLLATQNSKARIISARVGYEFEFGTPEYRSFIYKKLIAQLPPGTPVIVSDDAVVWASATALCATYPVIGVLHSDEAHYYALATKYQQQVAFFTCVSERIHRTVQAQLPLYSSAHIATIPCGIKLPAYKPTAGNTDTLNLVYAGRITDYQKRAGDLAKICVELAKSDTNFHLRVIGDGDAKATIEKQIGEPGLQQQVTFYGWLPQQQVAAHLAASDVLLLTSDFEGTPIAMMEALAAGCGLVGTRVSGIEDYEHHPQAPECYRVYDVGDIADAVNKIKEMATIPKVARQLAARQLATTEFSMEICLERYEQAINSIKVIPAQLPEVRLSPITQIYSRILAMGRSMKVRLLHR